MSRQRTGIPNIPRSRLSVLGVLLLAAALLPAVTPRSESLDPEFTRLPFARWEAEGKRADLHWSVEIVPAHNSTHQRLVFAIILTVDGKELEKRREQGGALTALIQMENSEGKLWQNHISLGLDAVQKGVAHSDVQISQYAFVLPGDYTIAVALFATATSEHNFALRRIHIAPLKEDPLPHAWDGLPAVEYVNADSGPPDSWYLPEVETRLNLPVPVKRPVRIEVLVNGTPSDRAAGSMTALRHNMSLMIPALKIFASMKLAPASLGAALLDLTRQRVSWEQPEIRQLDWAALRRFLQEEQPGKIDVHALERQSGMLRYFAEEIGRRMRVEDGTPRLTIVLSGPAFLQDQQPAELAPLTPGSNHRLIYIRERLLTPPQLRLRPGMARPMPPAAIPRTLPLPPDDLERVLRPLNPRIFEITNAEEFRRVLAAVMDQIVALSDLSK